MVRSGHGRSNQPPRERFGADCLTCERTSNPTEPTRAQAPATARQGLTSCLQVFRCRDEIWALGFRTTLL